jgi:drug/metabolite transporter (DMT)-like permease
VTSHTATRRHALLLGGLGVLGFSLTLPATKAADPVFGPWTIGIGRSAIAAVAAAVALRLMSERLLPPRDELMSFVYVIGGVVLGFPLLTSLALLHVQSSHAAVLTGLLPAATAGVAVLRAGERPRRSYWCALGFGLVSVLVFAAERGGGSLSLGDSLLLAAVVVAGIGYAEGGVLARRYGGWRTMCWALVLAFPITLPLTVLAVAMHPVQGAMPVRAVLAAVYITLISSLFAFFAWYEGLARGGVAKIGLVQLGQPVLTLGWSALLLSEHVGLGSLLTAALVLLAVAIGRRARVDPAPRTSATSYHRGGLDAPLAERDGPEVRPRS